MATYRKRAKADGSFSHTAYIRIRKGKDVVYTESRTFSKEALAKSWARKRESELEDPDELAAAIAKKQSGVDAKGMLFGQLIDQYIKVVKPLKPWGSTKENVLQMIKRYPISQLPAEALTTKQIVDYVVQRSKESSPQTANQDYMYIRQVLGVAEDLLGVNVDFSAIEKAQRTLSKIGAIAKSKERDRRPGIDELSDIVSLAYRKRHSNYFKPGNIMLDKVIVFAMFSGRRASEITRITRSDTDYERQEVLVRDMKHPGQKQGNDVWCYVPDEAWQVMLSMPKAKDDDRWFPYNARSVGDYFQRVKKEAGHHQLFDGKEEDPDNPNLRFHDLRHECTSWLFEKNGLKDERWDVPRVALVTGHQNWNSLKRYANLRHTKPIDRWAEWEWTGKVLD
ncbi:tyrosine-type recombinase/integrase [Bermanella sp. R86510]|uniref:tyrosine-type recombinase/integrase n=1 Tax=unclassified Bermanella TaxID=2627862 RepID=UPI0037C77F06